MLKYNLTEEDYWPGFSYQSENEYHQIGVIYNGKEKNMLEHRYIWILNCFPIDRYDAIHHINGDQTDNSIENLALMTLSEHRKYHTLYSGEDINYMTLLDFYYDNGYIEDEIKIYMPLFNLLEIEEIDEEYE